MINFLNKIKTIEKRCSLCGKIFLTKTLPRYTEHHICSDCEDGIQSEREKNDTR